MVLPVAWEFEASVSLSLQREIMGYQYMVSFWAQQDISSDETHPLLIPENNLSSFSGTHRKMKRET